MANPHKGETDLTLDGTTYTICLTAHEIVKLEHLYDVGVIEIAGWLDPSNVRLWRVQALLWASLQRHHRDITIDQALDMIANSSNLKVAVNKLVEAIQISFPPRDQDADENPQQASV